MPKNSSYNHSIASKYDRLRSWRPGIPSRMAEIAGIGASSRVLDLGCGTGNLGLAIHKIAGCSIIGLDASRDMISKATGKVPGAHLVLGDVTRMPFAAESFHALVGSFFIHHVPLQDRQSFANECQRILKAGGCMVLVTTSHKQIAANPMARFFPQFVEIDKQRFPDVKDLLDCFQSAGFSRIGSETVTDGIRCIDTAYADWVEQKPITTLDLIDETDFRQGMQALRAYIQSTEDTPETVERQFTLVFAEK